VLDQLAEIAAYLTTGQASEGYTQTQRRQLVTHNTNYQLIVGHMYKLGMRMESCSRCILEHECDMILYEAHEGIAGGHNTQKINECIKFSTVGLWWSLVFEDAKEYCKHL
jgi:hypothetical protein